MNGAKLFFAACVLLGTSLVCTAQITLMSFNIRYDNPADGANSWSNRQHEVAALIAQFQPHFLGIQEALQHQVAYLKSELASYDYIGVGREDGATQGEFAAIFYQKESFEVVAHETFWLSETPEKPSVGWDAALPRICTHGIFRDKQNGHLVHVFNVHFDHLGEVARRKSAELVLSKIKEIEPGYLALVLMGDFNAEPQSDPIAQLSAYFSTNRESDKQPKETFPCTFNGFDTSHIPTKTIDYIFVKGMRIEEYKHIVTRRKNGLWPSDHLPVFCELKPFFIRCGTKPRE